MRILAVTTDAALLIVLTTRLPEIEVVAVTDLAPSAADGEQDHVLLLDLPHGGDVEQHLSSAREAGFNGRIVGIGDHPLAEPPEHLGDVEVLGRPVDIGVLEAALMAHRTPEARPQPAEAGSTLQVIAGKLWRTEPVNAEPDPVAAQTEPAVEDREERSLPPETPAGETPRPAGVPTPILIPTLGDAGAAPPEAHPHTPAAPSVDLMRTREAPDRHHGRWRFPRDWTSARSTGSPARALQTASLALADLADLLVEMPALTDPELVAALLVEELRAALEPDVISILHRHDDRFHVAASFGLTSAEKQLVVPATQPLVREVLRGGSLGIDPTRLAGSLVAGIGGAGRAPAVLAAPIADARGAEALVFVGGSSASRRQLDELDALVEDAGPALLVSCRLARVTASGEPSLHPGASGVPDVATR